jgi:hypothetical protein
MTRTPTPRGGVARVVAGLTVLGTLAASGGCGSSAPGPVPKAQTTPADLPTPSGSLPEVAVTAEPTTRASAELTGRAWYVTAMKDPVGGSYTAAVERRSLARLPFAAPSDGEQRASIALVLRNGRPADLVLSIGRGQFACAGHDRDGGCPLHVSFDDAAPRSVRFSVPRHWPATHLHLVDGDDARRLLAAIGKAKHLRIQPTFQPGGAAEVEFALSGLSPAIARVMRHSVAATPKPRSANPGA